jgi:hypothetical protein
MVDAGSVPTLPTSPAAGSVRARVVDALRAGGLEPVLEPDGDLAVIVQDQRMFVQCLDTVPPLVRVSGQWLLDDSVGGGELDRLRAANEVTGGSNLVKVTLHGDRLVIAVDLLLGPDVELTSLLAASVQTVVASVHGWHAALTRTS